MDKELERAVFECQSSFRRIQALLEWRNLEMQESERFGGQHAGADSTRRDLAGEVLRFQMLSGIVASGLKALPGPKRRALKGWLDRLCWAVASQLQPKGI
jgi:hypothetical protein